MGKSNMPSIEAAEPKKDKEDIQDYEVENAMRDITRAEAHKANPKMMEKLAAHVDKQKTVISSVKGLKKKRQQLIAEDGE